MTSQQAAGAAPDLETIRQEIERHKDTLVEKAEQFFQQRCNRAREDSEIEVVPIERTQLENVLRLSLGTTSVKEVTNFIRYQMGREREVGKGWLNGDFGRNLIRVIDREIASLASEGISPIHLVRPFLGYFTRAAVYFRALEREEGNES
jgi:hypothetical protein